MNFNSRPEFNVALTNSIFVKCLDVDRVCDLVLVILCLFSPQTQTHKQIKYHTVITQLYDDMGRESPLPNDKNAWIKQMYKTNLALSNITM